MSEISTPRDPSSASAPRASGEMRRGAFLIGLLLFALALAVRCIGLTWGLPNAERWYSYHPDESPQQIVGAVFGLLQGDFNPHFFNYPSLTIYATWFFYQVMATLGLTTNVAAPQFPWPVVRDVILAGRLFSALCGAGTAVLTWSIARRLGLRRGAVLAAVLVALAPGHVQHSHFATVDVPATFFAMLCIWLTLRAQNIKGFLVAALVAGLAAGTKYNVGLVLIVPLVALWLPSPEGETAPPNAAKRILASVGCIVGAALGFLISTPYALLDFPAFWGDDKQNGFYFEAFVHPKIGSDNVFIGTGNGWWYHFSFNLPFLLTWPLVLAALVGMALVARTSGHQKRAWLPLLLFAGVFFLSLGFSQVRFMRYLLPLAPLLCLFAAYAASRLPKPQIWAGAIALFAVLGTHDVLWPFTAVDPRDQAASYIAKNFTHVGLIHQPWFYTPPFQPEGNNMPPRFPHPIKPVVTGMDRVQVMNQRLEGFVVSEFETREDLRLNPDGPTANFLKDLRDIYGANMVSGITDSILPGRFFVPHDYLYTSPKTTVYTAPVATNLR